MSVQELEKLTTIYTADFTRTPIGWGFTVYRNQIPIGRVSGWLTLRYRTQATAHKAAERYARHDRERHNIHLNA